MKRERDPLDQLDESIKRLRVSYEKYFAGVEKTEPAKERKEVKSLIYQIKKVPISSTARRFRLQTLQASMVTYENYWDRATKQIEEGTHRRDQFRRRQKQAEDECRLPPDLSKAEQIPAQGNPKPSEEVKENPSLMPRPNTQTYPESFRRLYATYIKARQQVGDTRPIAIDALVSTVKNQMQAIKKQYQCQRVEFKVVIKNGKAILKAIPK